MDKSLSAKDIRILHVRSTIGMYGAEKVLLNILPALAESYEISLLTLEGSSSDSSTLRILAKSKEITCIHYEPIGRFDYQVIKEIKKLVKENSYDLIHSHDYKSLFYISLIAKKLNIPIVHHIHGALGNTYSEKVYGIIERWLMTDVAEIFTVSIQQKLNLEKGWLNLPKIVKINNGTSLTSLNSVCFKSDCLRLIMVARLTEEKNHLLAVEAVNVLKIMGVNVSLTLLGDGPLRDDIQNLIEVKSLNDQIKLVGFTNDVQSWLDKSDVLLITSFTEGMPMNMLEAMGRGLPVISTAVGEVPFLIKRSGCGALFYNQDELVKVIEKISIDLKIWQDFGLAGRKYVEENLSVQTQVKEIINEYNGLLSAGNG
jgi:glycosyltransferase involved in cell wall biosynthesis